MDSPGSLLHWHADAVATMELFSWAADITEAWFKTLTIAVAAFWLSYRIYLVILKPVPELVDLLGLEVPESPHIALAGVKADGVLLGWKPPDPHSSVTKFHVLINGINIGEVSSRESSVAIENLRSDHSYTVRVVAANSNFQSASEPIRFTTKHASSDDFFCSPNESHEHGGNDEPREKVPTIRPIKPLFDASVQIISPTPMARDHSNSLSSKRSPQARRISPIITGADVPAAYQDRAEGEETVRALTEKLDSLRHELEEAERQEKDEADEFENAKAAFIDERDRAKLQWKEKDDTSKDLRKEVSKLETANRNAQGQKTTAERKLKEKTNERKKIQDDMLRWDKDMEKFKSDAEKLEQQKEQAEKETENKLEEQKFKLARKQTETKELEDENKEKAAVIKILEQEKRSNSIGEAEPTQQGMESHTVESGMRDWEETLRTLQNRYQLAWNQMLQAEAVFHQAQRHLDSLQQRRLSSPQLFAQTPTLEAAPVTRHGSNRRRRAGSVLSEMHSPSSAAYAASSAPPFNNSISSISPTFSSGSPFFNITNGMTLEPHEIPARRSDLTQAQLDALTGGAPMSPSTAGALLPSGLLTDDADQSASDVEGEKRSVENTRPSGPGPRRPSMQGGDSASLNASKRNSAVLPGLGPIRGLGQAATFDQPTKVPSSPVSADSRSPSLFSSPKESTSNLSTLQADSFPEPDRRSIRSNTGSSRGTTSRFSNLFTLRQKGKSNTDEGPSLGSLKTSQTQSLPRVDPSSSEALNSRRRGSHSGGWMQPLSNAFSRTVANSAKGASGDSAENSGPSESKFRPISSLFPRSGEPFFGSMLLNRSMSPNRPPSTHSAETPFPRPSTGSQQSFGWTIGETGGPRPSPLGGADWMNPLTSTSWSRHPSRRPSAQYGLADQDPSMLGPNLNDLARHSPHPAPIGTRPQTSQGPGSIAEDTSTPPTPPKLNPNAPSFSIFKRNKKADDGEKSKDKGKEKEKADDSSPHPDAETPPEQLPTDTPKAEPASLAHDSSSPSESRKSKDTRSISTANESLDLSGIPRESLERSNSRTPSESLQGSLQGTPNLTPTMSAKEGSGKESFMQRLSRKTSATGSKLKTPFSTQTTKGLFGSSRKTGNVTLTPSYSTAEGASGTTPDETDEDISALSRSVESMPSGGGSPLVGAITNESASGKVTKEGKEKENRGSVMSWSSLKLSKKKDKDKDRAPSINDSMASETGDEEELGLEGTMSTV